MVCDFRHLFSFQPKAEALNSDLWVVQQYPRPPESSCLKPILLVPFKILAACDKPQIFTATCPHPQDHPPNIPNEFN